MIATRAVAQNRLRRCPRRAAPGPSRARAGSRARYPRRSKRRRPPRPLSRNPGHKPPSKPRRSRLRVEAAGAPFKENDLAAAKEKNVNVRAKSAINSEIITRLKEGDTVTVMKEVTLSKPKTDEPSRWVQIALPEGTHVWVSTSFLSGETVTASEVERPQRRRRELQRDWHSAQRRHGQGHFDQGRMD